MMPARRADCLVHLYILQLADLTGAPVAHTRPLGRSAARSRVTRPPSPAPARPDVLRSRAGQAHALPRAGRSGADDQHAVVRFFARCVRMPALAPFLAHRRVLRSGSASRSCLRKRRCCSRCIRGYRRCVLLDLARQERIGDRRPRRADHVENAPAQLTYHRVGRCEPADADNGLACHLLHPADERLLRASGAKRR